MIDEPKFQSMNNQGIKSLMFLKKILIFLKEAVYMAQSLTRSPKTITTLFVSWLYPIQNKKLKTA